MIWWSWRAARSRLFPSSGNATELIIALVALKAGLVDMGQAATDAATKMKPHPFSKTEHESLGRDAGFLVVWRNGKVVRAD